MNFLIFMAGACLFSFMNVVALRAPRHVDFVKGRSMCPACGHVLSAADLIPVFGWLLLGGKCRYCKAPIPIRYLLMELLGGFCAVVDVMHYGLSLKALLIFAFFCMLVVVSIIDMETMTIPDELVLACLVIGLAGIPVMGGISILSRLIGAFCISLPMTIIAVIIPGGFGGGDIKLMAACGFFLGWQMTLVAAFIGIVSGGLYAANLIYVKKISGKTHFAFGPYLCFGMMLAVLVGHRILFIYTGSPLMPFGM